ncbi:hypothetical protein ACWGTI_03440 [Mesorhizobium sp. ArgA1]
MKKPVTVVAMPVYTPRDYPLIRQLPGADDMPSTWEEWGQHFEAYLKRREWSDGHGYVRVRIRPDLFKAWLDANSQVASDLSRQRYAQDVLDAGAARRAAFDEEHRQQIETADEWPAAPVYAPHDYPLILDVSATGDLPPTWEEWWENFKASEAEKRRQGLPEIRVRVHAGKFKAWLQDNSRSSTEQTRQQFAQERLRDRKAARLAAELPLGRQIWVPAPPPLPPSLTHRAVEVLAYTLLVFAICSLLIALKMAGMLG